MNRRIIGLICATVSVAFGAPAYAALVNFSAQGTVISVGPGNPYGLIATNNVYANAMFDDVLIAPSGSSSIGFGTHGNASPSILTFTVGVITFTEKDDIRYLTGHSPRIEFFDGAFTGFNFIGPDIHGFTANFEIFGLMFTGADNLMGSWDLISATISPKTVPLPAAFWLFGSAALIGLFGLSQRHVKYELDDSPPIAVHCQLWKSAG